MPQYVFNICSILPKLDTESTFYYLVNSSSPFCVDEVSLNDLVESFKRFKNVKVIDIQSSNDAIWEQILAPYYAFRNKVSLLHFPGNRLAFFSATPQVVTLHDAMEYQYINQIHKTPLGSDVKMKFFFWRRRSYVKLIYWFLKVKKSVKIITVSEASKTNLSRELNIERSRIQAILHGIPNGFETLSDKASIENRSGVLMFGGDSYQKNCENAITSWASLDEELRRKHPLTIVGFSGSKKSPVFQTIQQLGIANEVKLRGWVSDDELKTEFNSNRLLLFVSRQEGFGFPLLQAMAQGLPVVSSTAEVFTELSGGTSLHCDCADTCQIADAIKQLLLDNKLWSDLSNQGRSNSQNFTWYKSASLHLELYKELVNAQ